MAGVSMTDGSFPWLVLVRFVRFVDASGDILVSPRSPVVPGDLSQSRNAWNFAGRAFEVNSFHFAEHDCWCYELYEIDPTHTDNNYVDVRIPDLQPVGGPFAPAPAEHVTFTGHGTFTLPWQVFRHFVKAVEASGNINQR